MGLILYCVVGIIAFYCLCGIRIINQVERGVKFTLGKYSGVMEPGLNWIAPIFQSRVTVDIRQRTIDLEKQEVMTKDKVNLGIDGVVFYTVEQPDQAVLHVSDLRDQLRYKAESELKEIMGDMTMTEGLSNRDKIAAKLKERLNEAIADVKKPWGVEIKAIQINNLQLPDSLVRAMAKQAEAEREKEARVTKAEGERTAAKIFAEASSLFKDNPIALRLRELQTYQEIGTEHNTLMMVIPETMCNSGDGKWLIPTGIAATKKNKD
jgi:regulator of protease activity HflC (stomatin/prohibitin superfamily)